MITASVLHGRRQAQILLSWHPNRRYAVYGLKCPDQVAGPTLATLTGNPANSTLSRVRNWQFDSDADSGGKICWESSRGT